MTNKRRLDRDDTGEKVAHLNVVALSLLLLQAPCDTGKDHQAPLPTSSSTGQLAALRGAGQQHETIAEEDVVAEDEGQERVGDGADAEAGEKKDGADDNAGKTSRDPTRTHRRDGSSRRSLLMSIHVDSGLEPGGGGGRGGMTGQVSPASEARRGSMSPGLPGGRRCVPSRCPTF